MPLVFPWEKRFLEKKSPNLFFKPYLVYRKDNQLLVLLYRWVVKGKCPFLDENGRCGIHGEKPLVCKMYPLIIGLNDATIRVSGLCRYVREHHEEATIGDPFIVYRNEMIHALEGFLIINMVRRVASRENWVEIIVGESVDGDYIDIDEIIDMDTLRDIVSRELSKYSQKQS